MKRTKKEVYCFDIKPKAVINIIRHNNKIIICIKENNLDLELFCDSKTFSYLYEKMKKVKKNE